MDDQTQEAFFQELGESLRTVAQSHVEAAAAQDLSQSVLTRILEKELHLRLAAAEVQRWAFKALRHLLGNHFKAAARNSQRRVALEVEMLADPAPSPYQQMLSQERSAAFERACERLPDDLRRLVELRLEGASREAMIAALGVDSAEALRHKEQIGCQTSTNT